MFNDLRERINLWTDAREVFSNSGWIVLDRVARIVLALGVSVALARSLGRPDLVLPAILVGSLGTALGTYLGFAVAEWLR